ncbi:MAG: LPS-assembly protein LptD [Reyranella sp.]|jgi:LPS-assembly protein|nr:LPS-assembly protein LptD [Reyranella sp.]
MVRRPLRTALGAAILTALLSASPLTGQTTGQTPDQATLVADQILINADSTMVANGAVEVLYKGTRLTASKITFDQTSNLLKIEGPIAIDDGSGTVILASEAEISSDMRNGILKSARLVLQDQMQLAAAQMDRVDGRYTQLSRVVASSCQVCPTNPRPLWEIRASRVVHDQTERQLYFDNAQFRVAGVPVFWVPRLRMPDPTVDRATGFLLPTLRSSSSLGLGIKVPYFIAIGDSRDVTLTPFVTDSGNKSLAFRYREAFANGTLSFEGELSKDDLTTRDTRGYLFSYGSFLLPRSYRLGYQIETVTDDGYLLDYNIAEKDRLATGAYLQRTGRDSYFDTRIFKYNSLRAGDDNQTLPSLVGNLSLIRRMTPDLIGGQATLSFDVLSLNRSSGVSFDANGDGVTDGRDMTRATLGVNWRRQELLTNGMVLGFGAGLTADAFSIRQDNAFPSVVTRMTPMAFADLSWPWVKSASGGHSAQVIEPVVQLIWSQESTTPVPNEDSTLVEFDEGNLFSFSRFPGADVYESGLRANVGLSWSRYDPAGWNFTVAGGRIFRSEDLGQFSTGTRLSGTRSDWLLAMRLQSNQGLAVANRALFDDDFSFSKDELRLDWDNGITSIGANYVWLTADPLGGRPTSTSELAFDAGWQFTSGWRAVAAGRYDFEADRAAKAGIGLEYRNECAAVDLSLSRRFTSSTTVTPTTELSVAVRLSGFGTGSDGRMYRKSCGG